MLFAHLKRILKLDRLRLRGMSGATDEFTLAAAVQNLRRLAKFTSQGPPAKWDVRLQSAKNLKLTHKLSSNDQRRAEKPLNVMSRFLGDGRA